MAERHGLPVVRTIKSMLLLTGARVYEGCHHDTSLLYRYIVIVCESWLTHILILNIVVESEKREANIQRRTTSCRYRGLIDLAPTIRICGVVTIILGSLN
jgi:hypothetical protein